MSSTVKIEDQKITGLNRFLYLVIFIGIVFRFLYPFLVNPMNHLFSDPGRHYQNIFPADFDKTAESILDPPLPQLWLRAALALFTDTKCGVALYFALLCVSTPWFWYRWAREVFPNKRQALIFFAVLVLLPSWLGIYSYFMDETLVLPLLGLALWFSWRAMRKNTVGSVLIATFLWGLTLSTKLNMVFELIIVFPYLLFSFWQHSGNRIKTYVTTIFCLLMLFACYLIFPLWTYLGIGSAWLFPVGSGATARSYYLSGCRTVRAAFTRNGKIFKESAEFASPAVFEDTFEPLFDWVTCRSGLYTVKIPCDQKISFIVPAPNPSLSKRLNYMAESALHFFCAASWPDTSNDDFVQIAQADMRWIWSLLTLFVVILSIRKKQMKQLLIVLCLGTALLYIACGCAIIEGRYRKPWEGIVIAAFIFLNSYSKNEIKNMADNKV